MAMLRRALVLAAHSARAAGALRAPAASRLASASAAAEPAGADESAVPEVHQRNPRLEVNVGRAGTVEERAEDIGQRQVDTYKRLLRNPEILDGEEGLLLSGQQRAIAEAQRALPATSGTPEAVGGGELTLSSATGAQVAPGKAAAGRVEKGLTRYGVLNAPAPQITHGDQFPPRPAESGPGDQLMTTAIPEEAMLWRNELYEIFARHKADPEKWTPSRLAAEYQVPAEWVEVILRYTASPMYVQVDGLAYGVYDVIDMRRQSARDRRAALLRSRIQESERLLQLAESMEREREEEVERRKERIEHDKKDREERKKIKISKDARLRK